MADAPEVTDLGAIFPGVPDLRLRQALEQCDNDLELAIENLLNAPDETRLHQAYNMSLLGDMFPELDKDVVRRHLNECGGDVQRASDALLEYQAAKAIEEQLRIDDEKELVRLTEQRMEWDALDVQILTLERLSGLSFEESRTYFHKNGGNVCHALVDIIFHYKEERDKIELEEKRHRTEKIPATPKFLGSGRVQTGYTAVKEVPRYSLTLKEKAKLENSQKKPKQAKETENVTSRTSSSDSTTTNSTSTSPTCFDDNKPYLFNEFNPECVELANLVFTDANLVDISWNFYRNALILFKGDINRVLECAIFILENDEAQATYKDINKALDYSVLSAKVQNIAQSYASIVADGDGGSFTKVMKRLVPLAKVNSEKDTEQGLDTAQIVLQRNALKTAIERNAIDLHNFIVANAKVTVEKCLERWWNDEMHQREIQGHVKKSLKAYMIPPLTIVTGRGIHSDGGKSKVRHSIKTMLDKGPYRFEEEASRFLVTGRKA